MLSECLGDDDLGHYDLGDDDNVRSDGNDINWVAEHATGPSVAVSSDKAWSRSCAQWGSAT